MRNEIKIIFLGAAILITAIIIYRILGGAAADINNEISFKAYLAKNSINLDALKSHTVDAAAFINKTELQPEKISTQTIGFKLILPFIVLLCLILELTYVVYNYGKKEYMKGKKEKESLSLWVRAQAMVKKLH